jgi:small subunit ribosomal protein S20
MPVGCYHFLFLKEIRDTMANHASSLKRHRQSEKRNALNQMNRHKLKTQLRKLKTAIAGGKKSEAEALVPTTFGLIDKSVQKGVIAENTARRYKSRLAKSVNTIAAA